MVSGLSAPAQPSRHLADLAPASAPSSSMPHEPSSLLPSPAAADTLPPALPLKQHASAVLAATGVDMRGQGGAAAPAAAPQDREGGGSGGGAGGPAPALPVRAGGGPLQQQTGAGQPQPQPQPGPTPAAAAAPTPGAAPPAGGPPPSPGATAVAELEAILGRLMQIDKEGWFRHPVSELVAPKYYKIIKQPMCFEVMRGKIRGRQYLTWQEVVRDFELICSNALKYNQKRSHVYKQALTLSRAGKKVLAEVEKQGRRAMAALVAASAVEAAPASLQLMPADSRAVPSSLFRSGTTGASFDAALLRSQSMADTATTEGTESEPMAVDGAAWLAEDEADPAGYSSYEATDMEEEEGEEAAARQQAAALLDAVLAQPWAWLAGGSAAAAPADAEPQQQQQQQQQQGDQQKQEARPQQGVQQPAAPAAAAAAGHSREWKSARRGLEWRVRWLEHRLTELHHQRLRYQQQLAAEAEREAARQQAGQQPAAAAQQQQQGAAGEAAKKAAGQAASPAAAAQQPTAQPQQQPAVKLEDGKAAPASSEPAAAAAVAAAGPPPPRLWQHRPHQELAECQLPGLLQHPFIAAHSVLGARQQAAAGGGEGAQLPAAMDSEDFPAEVHAALDLLDQKLSSLRRQLVALQRPATQAALQRVQAVRVPGYRGGGGGARRGGGWTPRSGGATPRGTPRSGSLYRDGSLGKRRRVPEYDVGELITPLGAPKFVERAQVKTIDTPRVRPLPNTEVKKRQAALEAYAAQRKEGKEESEALEAIDAVCPGESSSEEDISDEAYLRRHHKMEVEERARYEAVLGAAVKKNKLQPKLSKDRCKQPGSARHVSRTVSAPAMVGNGGSTAAAAAAAAAAASPCLASPASSMLPAAASAPAGSLAAASAPAPASAAPSPATAGTAAAAPGPSPAAPVADPAPAADAPSSKQAQAAASAPAPAASEQQAQPAGQPSASGASGKAASSAAAAAAAAAPPSASTPSLAGPNGLPLGLMLPPLNPAQMAAQSMAAQMAQAHMAAMAAVVGPPGGKPGGSGSGAGGAAGAGGLLPPFGLTPAMAAAMAAAMPPLSGLPPGLQGILPNGGASAPANGRGSGRRGRPPGRGRGRR
ncbi:hypothetical protein ABPG75_011180 [Micractinium tetrahymenae]